MVNFYVLESAGFEPAHRLRGAKRLRRRQDVCCANAFSALDSTDPDDDDDDQHSDDPLQIVDASDEEVREILKRSESGSPSDEESKAEPACGACEDDFYAGFRCAGASCTHHSTTQGGLNADRPETGGSEPQLLTVECNLLFNVEGFHIFSEPNQPEFIDVECCLDSGAAVHATDRVDFPDHAVEAGPGSQAGQKFQAVGGKVIANEGQFHAVIEFPDCGKV